MRKLLKLPHPIIRLASLLTCSLAMALLISLGPTRLSGPVSQARVEPTLNLLSDEFDDPATLDNWLEGPSTAYDLLDIDTSNPGQMTFVPTIFANNAWYADYQAPFRYKLVSGDFSVVTYVNAGNRFASDPGSVPATGQFNSAGFVARNPASDDPGGSENYVMFNLGFQIDELSTEAKTTINSSSVLTLTSANGSHQGRLLLCRIGATFYTYRHLDNEADWTLMEMMERADLPQTLQVGLVVNAWDETPANSSLYAQFDYVRFAAQAPATPSECTALIDAEPTTCPNCTLKEPILQEPPERNPAMTTCAPDASHQGIIAQIAPGTCGRSKVGVYLHSGALYRWVEDLALPGRGFPFRFVRTYRSGAIFDGLPGHNWEFSYNRRLIVVGATNLAQIQAVFSEAEAGDVVRGDGYQRFDLYAQNPDGSYRTPAGFYTQLVQNGDGSFTERDRHGNRVEYAPPDENGYAPMLALANRNNDTMTFSYSDGLLETISDTLGRTIQLGYAVAPDGQTRLATVTDFSGRTVSYEQDANGDLVAVTGPAISDTPNGNDFPDGKTTYYAYEAGHNLTTITAPNEVLTGGPPWLQITYDGRNRVETLISGGTNASGVPAGGTTTFSYSLGETEVVDPNGNLAVYGFDEAGHILFVRRYTNRDVRPGDPAFYETHYTYNAAGEETQIIFPEGNSIINEYDDANSDPMQRGNRLAQTYQPDPVRSGDQESIRASVVYDPLFNQVWSLIGPRGHDSDYAPQNGGAWSPERYTTIYTYDYEEGCNFAALAAKTGRTPAEVQQLLSQAGVCLQPLGDVNGDGLTDQISGNLIRVKYPTVALLPESNLAALEGATSQEIVALFSYNQFGQLTSQRDPELNVTTYTYNSEQDPDGDGVINNPAGHAVIGGFKSVAGMDSASHPDRNTYTDPQPTHIRRRYAYDERGYITRIVDGRGIATDFTLNELGHVVQSTHAAAHGIFSPDPPEPFPLTDFQYLERFFYDANGNLIRRQVEDRGNTSDVGGDNGGRAYVDEVAIYDILNNQVQVSQEVSDDKDLLTRYRYDHNGNLVLTIYPAGNAKAVIYDERDLPFQTIRGAHTPPAQAMLAPNDPTDYDVQGGGPASNTYVFDGNGNLVEACDAADTDASLANNCTISGGGDRTRFIYDGFNRLTGAVDPLGNQSAFQYDPAGNLVRTASFGPTGGPSPTSDGPETLLRPVSFDGVLQANNLVNANLLAATEYRYDELSRNYEQGRALFVNTIPTVRPADIADGASDLGKGDLTPDDTCAVPGIQAPASGYLGCVTTRLEFDRNSRTIFRMEDDGDTYRFFYDGAGRVIKTEDPEGNIVETAYDDAHNPIESRHMNVAQLPGTPAEVFLTTTFYDSLRRPEMWVDNLGQAHYARYDSRGNQVAVADPQGPLTGRTISRRAFSDGPLTVNQINEAGNVILFAFDGQNRLLSRDLVLTDDGLGDGDIGVSQEGLRINPQGTRNIPAALSPDPAQANDGLITLRVSLHDNTLLAGWADDNGNRTQYLYDNLNRHVLERQGECTPPNLADRCDPPTETDYVYDPDGNLVSQTDQNGSVTTFTYDAANRLIEVNLARAAGVAGTTRQTFEYDGLGRLTQAGDNNDPADPADDSALSRAYDSLGRLLEESQQLGPLTAGSTAGQRFGPTASWAVSHAWRAEALQGSLTYPSGRQVSYTYDGLDRVVAVATEIDEDPQLPYTVYLPLILRQSSALKNSTQVRPGNVQTLASVSYIGPGRRLLERSLANGTSLTVDYDGLGRVAQLRHTRDDGGLLIGFEASYDRTNNLSREDKLHDPANDETYTRDSAYRLTGFDRPQSGALPPLYRDWTLDGAGNWQQVDGQTRRFTSFDELYERGGQPLAYDLNGNLIDDGEHSYKWDVLNRLRTITRHDDGKTIAFTYDAFGRLVGQTSTADASVEAVIVQFEADFVLGTSSADGASQREYIRADNGELLAMTGKDGQLLYYHPDSRNSVTGLTNEVGHLVEAYLYDPHGRLTLYEPGPNGQVDFGKDDIITPGGASRQYNPYTFNGLLNPVFTGPENNLGLYYDRGRFYDPREGRYLSRASGGGWPARGNNAYSFADNGRPVPVNVEEIEMIVEKIERAAPIIIGSLWNPPSPTRPPTEEVSFVYAQINWTYDAGRRPLSGLALPYPYDGANAPPPVPLPLPPLDPPPSPTPPPVPFPIVKIPPPPAPIGSGPWLVLVYPAANDEHGPVKIQFHWDRAGSNERQMAEGARYFTIELVNASIARIRPEADQQRFYGTHITEFTFSAPDSSDAACLHSQSGGINEIRFRDAAGSEGRQGHSFADYAGCISVLVLPLQR